jgi:CRP-like cAMP-binding protein
MREILDAQLLTVYLNRYHIPSIFSTENLPFRLYEFEEGELLNLVHPPKDFLKFIVEGSVRIYSLSPHGNRQFLAENRDGFEILGDLEFCGAVQENHYQEVISTVRTIELPLRTVREQLWQDNTFLRWLLRRIGTKLSMTTFFRNPGQTLEENLLQYMRYECANHCISSVEETAMRLNYSRAQLQRVLRDLSAKGILQKEGRGMYRLLRDSEPDQTK